MKLSPYYNDARDLAITVKEGERTVFTDPLSRMLFSEQGMPDLPYNCKEPLLREGTHPYLLFRRELCIADRSFALYAALPLRESDSRAQAALHALGERVMTDLSTRFLFLFSGAAGARVRAAFPIRAYFERTCEDICRSLYAPLDICRFDGVGDPSVLAHRGSLSQAIGLALAALLTEGQSGIRASLSSGFDVSVLSLEADKTTESDFVRALLFDLAARGGFSVSFGETGVHFSLSHAHTPAVALRSTDATEETDLLIGFTLLL